MINTYPEMNEKIVGILRLGGRAEQYAAQYIEELRAENAALRERIEKAVELPVKECLRILHNIGGCDATDDFSRGWDEAINTAFKEISEKYDVSAEKVFGDECNLAEERER